MLHNDRLIALIHHLNHRLESNLNLIQFNKTSHREPVREKGVAMNTKISCAMLSSLLLIRRNKFGVLMLLGKAFSIKLFFIKVPGTESKTQSRHLSTDSHLSSLLKETLIIIV